MISYKDIYDQSALEKDIKANCERPYQQCAISVMDTISDPNITFDEKGICNYYYEFLNAKSELKNKGEKNNETFESIVQKIKKSREGKYDCILGLSGGVDSSFLCHLLKKENLNPLVVHFDYGWNLELAVQNIHNLTKKLDLDLYTHVMDWNQFKDLQRSYFKASVLDLDVPADHMIFGALLKTASKYNIKYVISGKNIETEFVLPSAWNYRKYDKVNLINIHKKFGTIKLDDLPAFGFYDRLWYFSIKNIRLVEILNYYPYNKDEAKLILQNEYGWKDYEGKHFENIFTRFYQGYILLKKFNIDKRKAHLSNLIFSDALTKNEAINILKKSPYSLDLILEDKEFVAKKLGFNIEEFDKLLSLENIQHQYYGTDLEQIKQYQKFSNIIKPVINLMKKILVK